VLISHTTQVIVHVASLAVGTAGTVAAVRHLQRFSRKVPTALA
jgi:hypothetical protein